MTLPWRAMPPELLDVPDVHDSGALSSAPTGDAADSEIEIPSMTDLDALVVELDRIDAALAELG